MIQRTLTFVVPIVTGILDDAPAAAHEKHNVTFEQLVVYGRAEERIGIARCASEGRVSYDDLELPPLLRVGELVESVPGMVVTQHSGSGKADQYFLRGFNLDHGTDSSASHNSTHGLLP